MFFKAKKLNKLIEKAIRKTADEYWESSPKIAEHFFYGAVDISPQNLAVWFIFETDKDLCLAKENGLCQELTASVQKNLISFGYPKEAFSDTVSVDTSKIKINVADGASEEKAEQIINSLLHRKATVSFTTKEDIDKKANGNDYMYFH